MLVRMLVCMLKRCWRPPASWGQHLQGWPPARATHRLQGWLPASWAAPNPGHSESPWFLLKPHMARLAMNLCSRHNVQFTQQQIAATRRPNAQECTVSERCACCTRCARRLVSQAHLLAAPGSTPELLINPKYHPILYRRI